MEVIIKEKETLEAKMNEIAEENHRLTDLIEQLIKSLKLSENSPDNISDKFYHIDAHKPLSLYLFITLRCRLSEMFIGRSSSDHNCSGGSR